MFEVVVWENINPLIKYQKLILFLKKLIIWNVPNLENIIVTFKTKKNPLKKTPIK